MGLVVVVVDLVVVVSEGSATAGGSSQHGFFCTAVFSLAAAATLGPSCPRLQGLWRHDVSGVCNSDCMKARIMLCSYPLLVPASVSVRVDESLRV